MNKFAAILGFLFIILGIGSLFVGEIEVSKKEKVAEIGELKVTATRPGYIDIPPYASGGAIVAGLALVYLGLRKKP